MLAKELAQIHEVEMANVHARVKLLKAREKVEILSKKCKTNESILSLKNKEQFLFKFTYQKTKWNLMYKVINFQRQWIHKLQLDGYSSKELSKDKISILTKNQWIIKFTIWKTQENTLISQIIYFQIGINALIYFYTIKYW